MTNARMDLEFPVLVVGTAHADRFNEKPSLSGRSIYVGSGRFGTDSTRTAPVSTTAASAHNPVVNDPVRVFR